MNVTTVATKKLRDENEALRRQIADLKTRAAGRQARVDEEKEHLRAKYEVAARQLKRLVRKEEREAEHTAEVIQAVKTLEPLPKVNFIRSKKSDTPMSALLHLTDWHTGERIRKKETEGWGNFDWEIQQDRVLQQLVPRFLDWLETQRSGYLIEEIIMLCTADFISGDIHDELRRTNEFPIPVQTANAGDLLGHVARELARHCDRLRVIEVGADNHSRLVQKPQAKEKTENSMSYLVYHILNKELSQLSNVTVERAEGPKLIFEAGPSKLPILAEHGDSVKSWMSIPFYGMEREVAREAKRRMFGQGFKFVMMGHWHAPVFAPYSPIVVGGSLTGTSEYDHLCGRMAPPVQTAMLVGKRGLFGFVPFELR